MGSTRRSSRPSSSSCSASSRWPGGCSKRTTTSKARRRSPSCRRGCGGGGSPPIPAVVGRGITLDSTGFTIVGVMPQGFEFPYQADRVEIWIPDGGRSVRGQHDGRTRRLFHERNRPAAALARRSDRPRASWRRSPRGLREQYPQINAGRTIAAAAASRRHRRRLPSRTRPAARRGRRRPADCVRERRKPAARARRGPPQGDGDSHRARRGTSPPDPPAAGRITGIVDRGRRGRRHPCAVGRRRAGRSHAARDSAAAGGPRRRRRPRVCDVRLDGHGNRLRRRAGAAAVARGPRRSAERRRPRLERRSRGANRTRAGRRGNRAVAGAAHRRGAAGPQLPAVFSRSSLASFRSVRSRCSC